MITMACAIFVPLYGVRIRDVIFCIIVRKGKEMWKQRAEGGAERGFPPLRNSRSPATNSLCSTEYGVEKSRSPAANFLILRVSNKSQKDLYDTCTPYLKSKCA